MPLLTARAERAPIRNTEARITLGVIAARQGDIDQAVHYGERALTESRRSLPSLAMVSRDLARVLKERYPAEQATENYLDQAPHSRRKLSAEAPLSVSSWFLTSR